MQQLENCMHSKQLKIFAKEEEEKNLIRRGGGKIVEKRYNASAFLPKSKFNLCLAFVHICYCEKRKQRDLYIKFNLMILLCVFVCLLVYLFVFAFRENFLK